MHKIFHFIWFIFQGISKNFFVEKSPSPKKHQLSFIISKVIISRSAPPFLPKQGLSSSIPPGKFNFYNEIVTSFCIFFNLSDRFSYLKKEPPSFRESMSTKCLPNTAPKPLGGGQFEKAGKVSVYQMSTKNKAGAAEGEGLAKISQDLCLPKVNHRHFSAQFPPAFPHFHPIFLPFPNCPGSHTLLTSVPPEFPVVLTGEKEAFPLKS